MHKLNICTLFIRRLFINSIEHVDMMSHIACLKTFHVQCMDGVHVLLSNQTLIFISLVLAD